MKTRLFVTLITILLSGLLLAGCVNSTPTPTADDSANMANPASAYCVEHGGIVEIVTDENGAQSGICHIGENSCDEWAFFRGECTMEDASENAANMANPASVYCEEQGGTLEIVTDENGGQVGICHIGESACEEWAFYRGECVPEPPIGGDETNMANPASVYCEEQGGQVEMRVDESGGEYGMCILPAGECEEWAFFRGSCLPGVIIPNEIGYTNSTYGFSFAAAPDFSLDEHSNYVLYKNIPQGYQILIGFQWKNDELIPVRTGMPEGEFQDANPAILLGQDLPKKLLVYDGKMKVAAYGPVEVGDLRMVFYVDPPVVEGQTYPDQELTQEMQSAAETLIASFALLSGEEPPVTTP